MTHDLGSSEAPVAAEWLHRSKRHSSMLLQDPALGEELGMHYEHAPVVEEDRRRIISSMHLGRVVTNVEAEPGDGGWVVHSTYLPKKDPDIGDFVGMVQDIMTVDPRLDPLTKSIELLSATGWTMSRNQGRLLAQFEDRIIYEDDHLLVIDKPPFVDSHWSQRSHVGVAEIAQKWRGLNVRQAHRLDRQTSGVLVLGKSSEVVTKLTTQSEDDTNNPDRPIKTYVAMVDGELDADQSVWCTLEKAPNSGKMQVRRDGVGKLAKTTVEQLVRVNTIKGEERSLLGVRIFTGRMHQIRVSLAAIGLPVTGDRLYGEGRRDSRLLLHAKRMQLTHPMTGEPLILEAPLPTDFLTDIDPNDREAVRAAANAPTKYN